MHSFDEAAARQFFEAWFKFCKPGELSEVRPLNKRAGCRPLRQAWARSVAEALPLVRQRVEHGDEVYVGALPRSRRGGKESDVGSRAWLWADVDYGPVGHKKALPHPNRESALQAINALPVKPTLIVETGGGFHAWYALEGEPSLEQWNEGIARLCFALRADSSAIDLPRILRVPGTWNYKEEKARPVLLLERSNRVMPIGSFLSLPAPSPEFYGQTVNRGKARKVGERARVNSGGRPFDRANDVPIADVVAWLGIKTRHEGSRLYCPCPAHHGTNPHQMVVGGDRNLATCFGDCDRTFTCVDLVAAHYQIEAWEAVNRMAKRFGFGGFSNGGAHAPASAVPPLDAGGEEWEAAMTKDARGRVQNTYGNVVKILRGDSLFAGRVRFNEMRGSIECDGAPVTGAMVGGLREKIENVYGFSPGTDNMWQAVDAIANENGYHPVRVYLDGLTWDGSPRIDLVAREILGISEEEYSPTVRRMIRCWFISAIARARKPGSKVDTALVLVGPQGFYKSTFFRTLGGPWFLDTAIDLSNKDAFLQLSKAWIYEWPEIESVTSKSQVGMVKAFITSQVDSFRPPYARSVADVPRGCVIVGTTNEARFLNDATGSRRLWVTNIAKPVNIEKLVEWRDQLWAEASTAYAAGEPWWLDTADERTREESADEHAVADPWEELIAAWLERQKGPVKMADILWLVLGIASGSQAPRDVGRVSAILTRLEYEQRKETIRKSDGKKTTRRYWIKASKVIEAPTLDRGGAEGLAA